MGAFSGAFLPPWMAAPPRALVSKAAFSGPTHRTPSKVDGCLG